MHNTPFTLNLEFNRKVDRFARVLFFSNLYKKYLKKKTLIWQRIRKRWRKKRVSTLCWIDDSTYFRSHITRRTTFVQILLDCCYFASLLNVKQNVLHSKKLIFTHHFVRKKKKNLKKKWLSVFDRNLRYVLAFVIRSRMPAVCICLC